MPATKHALIRYKVLDQCFRSKKKYYIEDLIRACEEVLLEIDPESNGISLRQIRDDIAFMKSNEGWGIELSNSRDGKKMIYRYENSEFSINNMPLNDLEIEQLKSAFDILAQFKGMPQFEWIYELLPKLKVGMAPIGTTEPVMDFEFNPDLKGIGHLGELYTQLMDKRVLEIKYQPYGVLEPYEVILHPYYLKQYNSRWFLFGYNPETDKADWNLPLDRIVSFQTHREKYRQNTSINWEEYFDDIIGVTRPDGHEVETIILRFNEKTGRYIETKPLHRTQKSRWREDSTLEVSMRVMLNYELERLILSYADSVKVIHPERLAEIISTRLENGFRQYKKEKKARKL